MTLRQSWRDPRLNFGRFNDGDDDNSDEEEEEKYTLVGDDIERIWRPDTFIRESREEKVMDYFHIVLQKHNSEKTNHVTASWLHKT